MEDVLVAAVLVYNLEVSSTSSGSVVCVYKKYTETDTLAIQYKCPYTANVYRNTYKNALSL